jgi:hypothetical protein
VLKDVSDRVYEELKGEGYEARIHEPKDEGGPFEITLRGEDFDLDDLKSMVRVAEDFGLGLRLGADGSITFR